MKKLCLIILSIFFINLISAFTICIDTTSPTNPTNLNISSSGTDIILNWDAASDEPACSGIDYYVVLRDDNIIGNTSQNVLTFTESNVPYGTYTYGVYAVDKIGHNPGWKVKNDVTLSSGNGGNTNVGGGSSSTNYVVIPLKIGENLNLQKGLEYSFNINGEEHSLVVDSVGEDYIWVTISSDPIKVKLGFGEEAKEIDIDGDGINDISLEIIKIDNNKNINIEYLILSPEKEKKSEDIVLDSNLNDSENNPENIFARITGAVTGTLGTAGSAVVIFFIVGILGMAVTVNIVRRKRRRRRAMGKSGKGLLALILLIALVIEVNAVMVYFVLV